MNLFRHPEFISAPAPKFIWRSNSIRITIILDPETSSG